MQGDSKKSIWRISGVPSKSKPLEKIVSSKERINKSQVLRKRGNENFNWRLSELIVKIGWLNKVDWRKYDIKPCTFGLLLLSESESESFFAKTDVTAFQPLLNLLLTFALKSLRWVLPSFNSLLSLLGDFSSLFFFQIYIENHRLIYLVVR